jgi:CSLREA domain-containing protein
MARLLSRLSFILLALFLVLSLQPIQQARADALVVTTTADTDDGTCDSDCTLREAINASNASAGVGDSIAFNIPGGGTQVIALSSPLPTITDPVIIDATTNNVDTADCTSGPLLIVLDGSGAGAGANGLTITSGGAFIQGFAIENFSGNGIDISNNGSNTLSCNFIGTNQTGITSAGNGGDGILINGSPTNVIGLGAGAGNVISGNTGAGIHVVNSTSTNISGNKIGTEVTGTAARANNIGISLDNSTGTNIGTGGGGAGNVISGNTGDGIYVASGSQAIIQNNQIGTDFSGNNNLHNTGNGIRIDTSNGSTISNNIIKFNQAAGVAVTGATATGNTITSNQIASNTGLGIDLGANGVTNNDTGDIDNGPNGLQNFPVIATASPKEVVGTLNSTANGTFQIDIYTVGTCDASNHGEGDTFIASTTISLDGSGNGSFAVDVTGAVSDGQIVTAATTDTTTNSTSEFSACATVTTFPIYKSVPDAFPDPASTIPLTTTVGTPVDTSGQFVVTNDGTAKLTISVALTDNTNFTLVSPTGSTQITAGNSVDIVVQCNATTAGSFTTDVSISHNDLSYPSNPAKYTVTCDVTGASGPQYFTVATSPFIFNSVPLGGAGDFNFTITNNGDAPLTIDTSLSNTLDFRWQAPLLNPTPPQITIGPKQSRTMTVRCVPQQLGARTGTLTFTTNDPANATVVYNLQCNGTPGTINLTPTTLPNATVGTAYSQTLTPSAGTAPFTYTLVGAPAWLTINNAGQLSGTPTAAGTFTFTVDVADSAANTGAQGYTLTVDPALVPGYGSTPASGSTLTINTVAGTPGTATVTISETGTADLTITSYNVTGAPEITVSGPGPSFTITDGGSSQDLTLTCSSPTAGSFSATLTVNHNATGSPATYTVNCTVTAAAAPGYGSTPASGSTLTINTVAGTPGTATVTIAETGTADLTISSYGITGAPEITVSGPGPSFTITDGGSSQDLTLTCSSPTAGSFSATLTVNHNATGSPATYTVNCTVTAAAAPGYGSTPASGSTLTINTIAGTPGTATVTIAETGTADLTITSYGVTGAPEITVSGPGPSFTITDGGSSQDLTLTCSSPTAGSFSATLTVNHNATGSPATYTVNCTVTAAAAPGYGSTPASGSTLTINTIAGTPGTATVTIAETGTADLTITSYGVTGAPEITVSGPGPSFTITDGGSSQDLTLTCSSPTAGSFSATLTVNHNATGSPATYTVNCTVTAAPTSGYGSTPPDGSTLTINTVAGTPGTATVTINETGTADLTISSYGITGAPEITVSGPGPSFTITDGGSSQDLTLTCSSATAGSFSATLTVNHNATGSPATYTVNCTVTAAAAPGYGSTPASGSTLTINTVAGTPGTATVTISETGTADLTISSYSVTGAPEITVSGPGPSFTITDGGSSQDLTLTCSSATAGSFSATLTVNHNATGSPATYTVNCTVNSGSISITPSSLPPGTVNVPYTAIFASGGTAPFTFSVANPANLPPGISLSGNQLVGTPTTAGSYTFTINVVDANGNTGSQLYTLVINAAVPTVAPGTPIYNSTPSPNGTINVLTSIGLVGSSSLVISNAGTATLNITSYAITSGAPVISVTGSGSSIPISSGNSTTLTVQCSSVAAGTFTGSLRVNHNASGTPAVYNISCTVTTTPVTATPAVTVTPGPSPTPTPSLAGLCADLTGQTNPVVRADIPPGAVPGGNVYCRVLAQDGQFKEGFSGERIGNQAVLNLGVIQAVDVYGLLPNGISAPDFSAPVTVCLLGTGSLVYLDALNAPRPPVILTNTSSNGGYTCASIPDAGTVVLVQNGGNLPGASFPGAGGDFQGSRRTLNGCQIVTLIRLKLRSVPGLDGAQLGIVEANVTLAATARTSRWYRVVYNGKSAWIFAAYVRPVGTCGQ